MGLYLLEKSSQSLPEILALANSKGDLPLFDFFLESVKALNL
jgi:hypothetical protein